MRRYWLGAHAKKGYRLTQDIDQAMQWFKEDQFAGVVAGGRTFGVSLLGSRLSSGEFGNITDELIQRYIEEQEGEPIVDGS